MCYFGEVRKSGCDRIHVGILHQEEGHRRPVDGRRGMAMAEEKGGRARQSRSKGDAVVGMG
jgi:hypothetical protein